MAAAARELKRMALWMRWHRIPFAVNGVLRLRWRVRWHKLWEYSRGLAYGDFRRPLRVLDLGGAATLPVFYLARLGCEVLSLDIDERLSAHTNAVASSRRWNLRSSTWDLAGSDPPAEWGTFDRVVSYCVLEHLEKEAQARAVARMAWLLEPGGIMELTFDFGEEAPVDGAFRHREEVARLVAHSGLGAMGNPEFVDTGERYRLDRKYPNRRYTFGSLFLVKAAGERVP